MTTTIPGRVSVGIIAPPTWFARQSSTMLVADGYDVARRAVGKALERVPFDDAAQALAQLADSRDDVLRIAQDYLGYRDFGVPLAAQVDALALVERARYRLGAGSARPTLATRLRRVLRPAS